MLSELAALPLASTTARDFTALERALHTAETFAEGLRVSNDGTRLENAPDCELLRRFIDALRPPILETPLDGEEAATYLRWPIIEVASTL